MNTRSLCAILVLACSIVSAHAKPIITFSELNALGPAHYIKGVAYAFDFEANPYDKSKHRIISTYLSDDTLVFPIEHLARSQLPAGVNMTKFGAYVTQYGQILLIRQKDVSNATFAKNYSGLNILFHRDSYLCSGVDEIGCGEDEGEFVPKGWVAKSKPVVGAVKLTFFSPQGETSRVGYVSYSRFDEMESKGVISDTNKAWPRYVLIEKKPLHTLSKECGPEKTITDLDKFEAEARAEVGVNVWSILSFAFNISRSTSSSTSSVLVIGPADKAIRRYELTIAKPDASGRFSSERVSHLFVTEQLHCVGPAIDSKDYYVETAVIQGDGTPFDARKTFTRTDFYHDRDLKAEHAEFIWNHDRHKPFFLSINHRNQYEKMVDKLQKSTSFDIAAVNLLVSFFNATCETKTTNEKHVRSTCRGYME